MLVPLSWLRDFAPFEGDPKFLAETLDDLGLVVEGVKHVGEGLEDVVVARVLEINAIFGGAEVKIPQNWNADLRGVGIFGGFGDETLHPDLNVPGTKRLIVRGAAVFGGVGVKN